MAATRTGAQILNTTIHYEYRDGANYKRAASWTIKGQCSMAQRDLLMASCMQDDGLAFFVPQAVGIPALQPRDWDDDIDHPMHSITGIEMGSAPADDVRSIHDLLAAFRGKDWNAEGAAVSLHTA